MLSSDRVELRLVREQDLPRFYELMSDLGTRGSYFPLGLMSEPAMQNQFAADGFWSDNEGMLLICDSSGDIVGEIEYFPVTSYLSGYELSYHIFGDAHAGKGFATEAVGLLSDYLYARKHVRRLQLNIHPDNTASKRVAEKSGFEFESIMHQCWYHQGKFHDLEIWVRLRPEAQ